VGDLDDPPARPAACRRPVEGRGRAVRRGVRAGLSGLDHQDRSTPGHIGNPRTASAEKGEVLFSGFTDNAVAFLERVIAWDGKSWDG
jgi:hypothetical protein